jgi:hypothetical protein
VSDRRDGSVFYLDTYRNATEEQDEYRQRSEAAGRRRGAALFQLWKQCGWTQAAIAAECPISKGRVSQLIDDYQLSGAQTPVNTSRTDPGTDPRLSGHDRAVLTAVAAWPGVHVGRDQFEMPVLTQVEDGSPKITLDRLVTGGAAGRFQNEKQQVFLAVARLEDFGYLPSGVVR